MTTETNDIFEQNNSHGARDSFSDSDSSVNKAVEADKSGSFMSAGRLAADDRPCPASSATKATGPATAALDLLGSTVLNLKTDILPRLKNSGIEISREITRKLLSIMPGKKFAVAVLLTASAAATAGAYGYKAFISDADSTSPATSTPSFASVAGVLAGSSNDGAAKAAAPTPAPAEKPAPVQTTTRSTRIRNGDTLMQVMQRAGADRAEAHSAITALSKHYNPRRLQIGQAIALKFALGPNRQKADAGNLLEVSFNADVDRLVRAERDDSGGFTAHDIVIPLDNQPMRSVGIIDGSLFVAAQSAGIPSAVIVDMIRIFSFDVDFQRDIRQGDSFEIYFDRFHDANGDAVKNGAIHFARLTLSGKEIAVYRHHTADDGRVDYYDNNGHSVRKALMRTPVDGARLTSRYGKRKHPVLGYTKVHKGIDFGAPRGTPIMAAGDGVVERASRWGGFGKYVRIRHGGGYKTAYAHMNGYGKGVRSGKRVKQGQIIGYIGSTGRSTGPHLHYEILKDDRHVNPLTVRMPAGRKLKGDLLEAFLQNRGQIQQNVAATTLSNTQASLR